MVFSFGDKVQLGLREEYASEMKVATSRNAQHVWLHGDGERRIPQKNPHATSMGIA
jgi:hypothetical protein